MLPHYVTGPTTGAVPSYYAVTHADAQRYYGYPGASGAQGQVPQAPLTPIRTTTSSSSASPPSTSSPRYHRHHQTTAANNDFSSSVISNIIMGVPWKPIFQRLPGTWLLLLIPFAILGPIYLPLAYATYFFLLHIMFLLNNLRSAYAVYVGYRESKKHSTTDWLQQYMDKTHTVSGSDTRHDMPYDHVTHIIILPNYKEDLDTLCETLDVLASHQRAVSQYKICLAMEESETGCQQKAHELIKLYANSFFDITYTVHPAGRPNEIRGKSSNVAWAVTQMAIRGSSEYGGGSHGFGGKGAHSHELVTVMDADTCFAEDYFTSITYHYAVASPEERKIMMFAPCTVFDRNASSVPLFVRTTDMFWSIGVMSNLYPGSPVKIPCSAYSVSMDLATGVGFWDAGAEAIGEDMHMYLKCFFSTEGRVIVKSVFSPASSCNIEGEVMKGWAGFFSCMSARYTQAKRHLWGSLDTGYSLRRALSGLLAPEPEDVSGKGQTQAGFDLGKMVSLFHRLLEAHVFMGHFCVLMVSAAILLPIDTAISYDLSSWIWEFLSEDPVHPYVELSVTTAAWIRIAIIIPNIIMIFYYEKYHRWVGFERWALQEQDRLDEIRSKMMQHSPYSSHLPAHLQHNPYPATAASSPYGNFPSPASATGGRITDPLHPQHANSSHVADRRMGEVAASIAGVHISDNHRRLRVQHLGRRPQLAAAREFPRCVLDWCAIPVSGLFFYVMPQFHAQISHLFTDSLEYKVAAKPQLVRPPMHLLMDAAAQKQPPSYASALPPSAARPAPPSAPVAAGVVAAASPAAPIQPLHPMASFGQSQGNVGTGPMRTYLGYHPPPSPSLGHGILAPPSPVPASAVRGTTPASTSSSSSSTTTAVASSSTLPVPTLQAPTTPQRSSSAASSPESTTSSLGRAPPSYHEAAAAASTFFEAPQANAAAAPATLVHPHMAGYHHHHHPHYMYAAAPPQLDYYAPVEGANMVRTRTTSGADGKAFGFGQGGSKRD